jgi:hypothetical protein
VKKKRAKAENKAKVSRTGAGTIENGEIAKQQFLTIFVKREISK